MASRSGRVYIQAIYYIKLVNFSQRMILSMLAILLLFALINGLLVYSMIKKSDEESVAEFDKELMQDEMHSIDSWLGIARSIIDPYVAIASNYQDPDSTESYKNKVLYLLKKIHWNNDKYEGHYFVFEAKTGNAVIFRDTLRRFMLANTNVFEIADTNGIFFAKEILRNAQIGSTSAVKFTYLKSCDNCHPEEIIAKGIYIEEWDWIIATGSYSKKFEDVSKFFTEEFRESRLKLMGNLFGIMLISFLVGLFMIFKQMNSFTVPLHSLSKYLHRLANEGIRFEDFTISEKAQTELKILTEDLNSLVHNIGALIENVHVSADRVSDLSGACTDMLDIVDYDAKLVGQRTAEMATSSEYVIEKMKGMVEGIEEINVNLDGLKKLASHITENTTDIKSSISQMNASIKELKEKALNVQASLAGMQDNKIVPLAELSNAISNVVNHITEINSNSQYINSSIKNVSSDINEAYRNLGEIVNTTDSMNVHGKQATERMDEFFLKAKKVEEAHSAIEHTLIDAKDSMKSLNDLSANLRKVVDDIVRLDNKKITL